jgi:putative ABC transport system ATP-binding protein
MAKTVVIEAKKLHKTFTLGDQKIEVLKGVDFEVDAGEYVIFFGPSGCGKSTLLNIICGLEPPTEGELIVRDENLYKKKGSEITEYRRSKIGIIFQQFNLLKSLTVQENVALPITAGGESLHSRMDRAAHLLDKFGLKEFLKRKPTELSGGQQQRVSIARALATNPWILICDEPTGNLDSKSASEVMEIIARLNQKSRRTILLVTHNPDYLEYPHRVIYMKDGLIEKQKVNRKVELFSEHEHKKGEDVDLKDIFEQKKGHQNNKTEDKDEKEQK